MSTPCENDRKPERIHCDREATHQTPAGMFLCDEHATAHNLSIESNKWIKDKKRYLAVPRC